MTEAPTRHFAFAGRRLLLVDGPGGLSVPDDDALASAVDTTSGQATEVEISLRGRLGGPTRVHDLSPDFVAPEGFALVGLRRAYPHLTEELFGAAATAFWKLDWLRTHRFCSRCGRPTMRHATHEAMACPVCGHLQFPRVAPAVIVLIQRGRQALLARGPRFPRGMYSTIAGFVEAGESLEEAVHREVEEEVGVRVTDLRYFRSQPWPFPHSLMVGFSAQWAGGDIRIDVDEIEDARWFDADALPPLPPPLSIARSLLEDFLTRVASDGA
jgi:NAD+ diphosphatase